MYSNTMTKAVIDPSIGCIKAATAILGDKWTPQLLRFFINEEVVRFCQIQDLVGGINPRTLSARLDHLEDEGIITKLQNSSNSRCEYTLTPKGQDLLPVLRTMEEWSEKYA